MNDQAYALDQVDHEIFTATLSDEALEAAAGAERRTEVLRFYSSHSFNCPPCQRLPLS
jgi:hypothetical protein